MHVLVYLANNVEHCPKLTLLEPILCASILPNMAPRRMTEAARGIDAERFAQQVGDANTHAVAILQEQPELYFTLKASCGTFVQVFALRRGAPEGAGALIMREARRNHALYHQLQPNIPCASLQFRQG
ncbi:hypothetical protein HZC09_03110 [Candidatus Micrarchaeota archaeon]|nr:hypothetical protein [Candidatus Micrarchaeota archaeon]